MLARLTGVLSGVLLWAGSVIAQQEYEAPQLKTRDGSTALTWAIGAVFLLGCLVVAFKPAKRSDLR